MDFLDLALPIEERAHARRQTAHRPLLRRIEDVTVIWAKGDAGRHRFGRYLTLSSRQRDFLLSYQSQSFQVQVRPRLRWYYREDFDKRQKDLSRGLSATTAGKGVADEGRGRGRRSDPLLAPSAPRCEAEREVQKFAASTSPSLALDRSGRGASPESPPIVQVQPDLGPIG